MSNSRFQNLRLPTYGGQAVIEGVLMRGKKGAAMAVRSPSGEILIFEETLPEVYRSRWFKLPFFRGLVILWDSLGLGMKFLTQSANVQTGEDEKLDGKTLFLTLALSLSLGVGFFFLLPTLLAGATETILRINPWWGNIIEGFLRLIILMVYLFVIGRIPEINRVFMYHGAEHKTINAFEARQEMTPEIVSQQTKYHPRCGTSFTLTLVFFSVLLFSLIGPLPLGWRLLSRILLIPILTGISYEYIRWAAREMDRSRLIRWLMKPNLLLQNLTTREPSIDMLEVAITSFQKMYAHEEVGLEL